MNNEERYHFKDFTIDHYETLLELIVDRSKCISYRESLELDEGVLWRHDIDFDLQRASEIARLENSHGVKATYFVLTGCAFYNLKSTDSIKAVQEIIDNGHDIGLHFDAHGLPIDSEESLIEHLQNEKEFLEGLFSIDVDSFSFHITNPFLLSFQKDTYAGMVNTYSERFQVNTPYCSDSNGYWRHQRLQEFLESHTEGIIQVLTHPIWWTDEVLSPQEKIEGFFASRAEKYLAEYHRMLNTTGRKLVSSN